MQITKSFKESLSLFGKDKWIILFSIFPILIGLILFYFAGSFLYTDVLEYGRNWIENKVSTGSWSSFFYYILVGLLTIGFYFLLSWTFVLVVSLFACPFNDIISSRVERLVLGKEPEKIGETFSRMMKRIIFILFNELKKVGFILFLNIVAFVVSFVGILAPVSALIAALLMAVNFLDYSWSRRELSFRSCLNDIRSSFIGYSLTGALFLFLISMPIVNLFALPLGVIYFTVLHTKKYDKELLGVKA